MSERARQHYKQIEALLAALDGSENANLDAELFARDGVKLIGVQADASGRLFVATNETSPLNVTNGQNVEYGSITVPSGGLVEVNIDVPKAAQFVTVAASVEGGGSMRITVLHFQSALRVTEAGAESITQAKFTRVDRFDAAAEFIKVQFVENVGAGDVDVNYAIRGG